MSTEPVLDCEMFLELLQACQSAETSMRGIALMREAIAKAEGKMNHDNEPDKEPK